MSTSNLNGGIRTRILALLRKRPHGIRELAKSIRCTPNTLYVYLHHMRKEGLIERQPTQYVLK